MREREPRSNPAARAAKALVVLALCLLAPSAARAQWTPPDAGGHIGNTNPGNVKIGGGTAAPTAVVHARGNLSSPLTGTVAVTQNSADVTGTGTAFNTELAVGDSVKIGSEVFTVSAVPSATSLTLDSNYLGASASGVTAYRDPNLLAVDNGDGANRLTVTRAGRVGVGTAAPNFMLEVIGSRSRNTLAVTGTGDSVGYAGIRIQAQDASNIAANRASAFVLSMRKDGWYSGDSSGPSLIIESTSPTGGFAAPIMITPQNHVILNGGRGAGGGLNYGWVGVGTVAPENHLHVHGSTWGTVRVSGQSGALMNFHAKEAPQDAKLYQWRSEGGLFRMALVNDVELNFVQQNILVANSAGNVGFGVASPAYKLDVAGQVRSSAGGFVFPDGTVQMTAAAGGGTLTGVTAGAGLTGGGTSGSPTIDIAAGVGLTAAPDSISVNYGSAAGTAVQGNTTLTVAAGAGLSGGGTSTLGAGGTLTLANADRGSAQNIFKHVADASGAVQFSAGKNDDAISFEGTGGATVTFNPAARRVTINSSATAASGWTDSGSVLSTTNTSARVGIGTASPTQLLDISGPGEVKALAAGTTSAAVQLKESHGTPTWSEWQQHSDRLRLNTGDGTTTRPDVMAILPSGVVGIGTATPGEGLSDPTLKLDVAGSINVGGSINAKYQDVAEWVPSVQKLAAGTVVVLDVGRTNHVLASTSSYDTKVAGVVSAQPGIALGEAGAGKALVATTGRVKVKVDATRGAIKVGDLLVTSGAEGVAMRSVPVDLGGTQFHRPGTIIGKALEPLEKGTGEILVLLSLQ